MGCKAVLFCIVLLLIAHERCQRRLSVAAWADRAVIIRFARAHGMLCGGLPVWIDGEVLARLLQVCHNNLKLIWKKHLTQA